MTIYTVLAPPARPDETCPDPDRFVFVKEGFCWPAFYMTIPWVIWRGMWLVLVAYLLAAAAVFALAGRAPPVVALTILVLFGAFVGLEANNFRRWTLERRGYRFLGAAAGDRETEAEYRFFAGWTTGAVKQERDGATSTIASRPVTSAPRGADEIVGLFPMSGARQ